MSKSLPIVAIVGRPNVGKSSLFNRLLGERKAVVADQPGTTRDRVEGIVEWSGSNFWLVDTAGSDSSKDEMAQSVHAQIEAAQDAADMIIIVLDSSTILSDEDSRVIKTVQKTGKPYLIAHNKADRKSEVFDTRKLPAEKTVRVSATHGTGSGDLLDAVAALIPKVRSDKADIPVLALLGRPNVGKSSILNALAGTERSIVSEQAGTTRDTTEIGIVHESQDWRVIDTAGLRRSSKAKDIEYFSALRTSRAINESDVCALILDATEPATAQDQRIAGMIKEAGKGAILVVNKWDQTDRSDTARRQLERHLTGNLQFLWWAPMVLTIAPEGHHTHKILSVATTIQKNRKRHISTQELNRVLGAAIHRHPPAGLKNRHPKLNYMTQTDTEPPTFAVFGSQTPFLHWSYKRYLETRLREEFDFTGTPLRLQWRSKH